MDERRKLLARFKYLHCDFTHVAHDEDAVFRAYFVDSHPMRPENFPVGSEEYDILMRLREIEPS